MVANSILRDKLLFIHRLPQQLSLTNLISRTPAERGGINVGTILAIARELDHINY
jgi:hypothetical protein